MLEVGIGAILDRPVLSGHQNIKRGVKIGVGTSLLRSQWTAAEIYPRATSPLLILSGTQRRQLEMFACI